MFDYYKSLSIPSYVNSTCIETYENEYFYKISYVHNFTYVFWEIRDVRFTNDQ